MVPPSHYYRYVALKITVAELIGRNNEIKIHRHLALQSSIREREKHLFGGYSMINRPYIDYLSIL